MDGAVGGDLVTTPASCMARASTLLDTAALGDVEGSAVFGGGGTEALATVGLRVLNGVRKTSGLRGRVRPCFCLSDPCFFGGRVEICFKRRVTGAGRDAVLRHDGNGGQDGDDDHDDEQFDDGEALPLLTV